MEVDLAVVKLQEDKEAYLRIVNTYRLAFCKKCHLYKMWRLLDINVMLKRIPT